MRQSVWLGVLAVWLCSATASTASPPTLREVVERSVASPDGANGPTPAAGENAGRVSAGHTASDPKESAPAPTEVAAPSDGEARSSEPQDALGRDTPRGALEGLLRAFDERDFERAAEYLDLRGVPTAERSVVGPALAKELRVVLARTVWVDPDALSDSPRGDPEDGLSANRDRLARIEPPGHPPIDLLLQRSDRGDHVLVWRIAPTTVAAIPRLYRAFGHGLIGDLLPDELAQVELLGLPLWQWFGLALDAALAWFVALGVTVAAARLASALARQRAVPSQHRVLDLSRAPTRLLLGVFVFSAARNLLGLSVAASTVLGTLEKTVATLAIVWWLLRGVDMVALELRPRLLHRGQGSLAPLVGAVRKFVKAMIVILAGVTLLHNAGFNVSSLLAGLGIGGIAIALAAQKSLENLFGGITLFLDRPVRIGDLCRFGDRVGTVEEIGLRSTRIRTPDRTLVAVPNSEFVNLQLENLGSRDQVWFHPTLCVRSDTRPDQMKHILAELTEMLAHHEGIEPNGVSVRFVGFGPYSLNIELSAYVDTDDWSHYLLIAEDLHLRCMEIIERAGSGLAFSAPPVHTPEAGDPPSKPLAPERSRRRATQVRGVPRA
jgi:MscS family membrane protein